MYRKEQGFHSRTCLPSGGNTRQAGRGLRFPFSLRAPAVKPVQHEFNAPLDVVQKQSFLFIPHRAKNLINIGLLALFFCPLVCQNIRRRIFL